MDTGSPYTTVVEPWLTEALERTATCASDLSLGALESMLCLYVVLALVPLPSPRVRSLRGGVQVSFVVGARALEFYCLADRRVTVVASERRGSAVGECPLRDLTCGAEFLSDVLGWLLGTCDTLPDTLVRYAPPRVEVAQET